MNSKRVGATECANHTLLVLCTFTVPHLICPPVRKVHAGPFRSFRNPPNSDVDYRIFNVSILLRAYTHGVWAHRQRVSTGHFLNKIELRRKWVKFRTGVRTTGHESGVRRSTNCATPSYRMHNLYCLWGCVEVGGRRGD